MADDDPRVQAQQMIAEARQAFARDVDRLLHVMQELRTVPEEGHRNVVELLRVAVLARFDQRLDMRAAADPVLRQLLREAYDAIGNFLADRDRDHVIDLRDWLKAAEPFLKS